MAGKPKHVLAREHLDSALHDIENGDERGAVNALFCAAEAAVVAVAEAEGLDAKRDHRWKAG